ncbi:MAG: Periplasmic copper-binding protein (NosD) [Candidatus Aminicenantes bacterium]|jgi:parallel beta-helix repeat protein|nr:Periplasmic copper-binding protein (NosD) [Candidatus Aminicenantes bacterium]
MILMKRAIELAALSTILIFTIVLPPAAEAGATWTVNAKMTLEGIQAVIDQAGDGDTVVFEKGAYDFSGAPFRQTTEYVGALNIVDKSLVLEAQRGVIIKGARSVLNGDGYGESGIVAFHFKNVARDKDVAVKGFSFKTMLEGIGVYGCRNVVVQNCIVDDMDRNGVGFEGVGGDLTVENNQIGSWRVGIFADWYYFDPTFSGQWDLYSQTLGTQLRIADNVITRMGEFPGSMGIYLNRFRAGQITGNAVASKGGEEGIYIASMKPPDVTQTLPRCVVSGNTVQGGFYGIDVTSASGVQVDNNTVSGTNWGIDLVYASDCSVFGNTISDVVARGIFLYGDNCTRNQVTGNLIKVAGYPGWATSGNSYGITTSAHHNVYSRNTVTGTGSVAFYIYAGHDEVFECNNAKNFKPAPTAAHYVFFTYASNNRFSETWANGVCYLDFGTNNTVTTVACR